MRGDDTLKVLINLVLSEGRIGDKVKELSGGEQVRVASEFPLEEGSDVRTITTEIMKGIRMSRVNCLTAKKKKKSETKSLNPSATHLTSIK